MYQDVGQGPIIVLVHGLPTDGNGGTSPPTSAPATAASCRPCRWAHTSARGDLAPTSRCARAGTDGGRVHRTARLRRRHTSKGVGDAGTHCQQCHAAGWLLRGPDDKVMVLELDPAFDTYNADRLRAAGTLLPGRRSFDAFKSFWPPVAHDPHPRVDGRAAGGITAR